MFTFHNTKNFIMLENYDEIQNFYKETNSGSDHNFQVWSSLTVAKTCFRGWRETLKKILKDRGEFKCIRRQPKNKAENLHQNRFSFKNIAFYPLTAKE